MRGLSGRCPFLVRPSNSAASVFFTRVQSDLNFSARRSPNRPAPAFMTIIGPPRETLPRLGTSCHWIDPLGPILIDHDLELYALGGVNGDGLPIHAARPFILYHRGAELPTAERTCDVVGKRLAATFPRLLPCSHGEVAILNAEAHRNTTPPLAANNESLVLATVVGPSDWDRRSPRICKCRMKRLAPVTVADYLELFFAPH